MKFTVFLLLITYVIYSSKTMKKIIWKYVDIKAYTNTNDEN